MEIASSFTGKRQIKLLKLFLYIFGLSISSYIYYVHIFIYLFTITFKVMPLALVTHPLERKDWGSLVHRMLTIITEL